MTYATHVSGCLYQERRAAARGNRMWPPKLAQIRLLGRKQVQYLKQDYDFSRLVNKTWASADASAAMDTLDLCGNGPRQQGRLPRQFG
jgi:hypothetical protein